MVTDEYIHINEAADVYGRTRQTFYNYVNKGLIASKKINNKLYLKKSDIEKLVNDYIELLPNEGFTAYGSQNSEETVFSDQPVPVIEEEPTGPVNRYGIGQDAIRETNKHTTPGFRRSAVEKGSYSTLDSLHNLQDDLLRLHKQAYELKDELNTQLQIVKNDLMFDNKNTLFEHEQKVASTIQLQTKEIEHIQNNLFNYAQTTSLQARKTSFWLGYVGFVVANIVILRGVIL